MSPAQAQQAAILPDYLRKRGLIRGTIFTPANVWKMVLLAVVFLFLHLGLLNKLVRVWWTEPDWSHGFIIPLFSIYFIASHYQSLLKVKVTSSSIGLLLMMMGLCMEAGALHFRNDYGQYLGMITLLFGMVLWLTGWRVIRIVWLPILFLFFAINVPEMVYRKVAYQFQQFAAHASVFVLQITGVQADMAGDIGQAETVINLLTASGKVQQLNVEQACSGMRLLMAFGALAVAISYLSDRPTWQRAVLIICAMPVALFCNLLRVVITGYLYNFGYPEYAQGLFHTFTGLFMLIPAGLIYLGIAKLMDLLVVEDYSLPHELSSQPAQADTATNNQPATGPEALHATETAPQIPAHTNPSAPAPVPKSISRQITTDKGFIICLLTILLAAGALHLFKYALNVSFIKLPAPLRESLASLPKKLGSFEAMEIENPETHLKETDLTLSEDVVHSLGTELYLQRNYQDTQPDSDGTAIVTLFTTYYTGKPVLVPHVPERCQAAAGYTEGKSKTFTIQLPGFGLPDDTLTIRATAFSGRDISGTSKSFAIIYFFVANGKYFDYWMDVRFYLTEPQAYFFDKHSYYAFMRMTFPQSNDQEQCIVTAKKFLKLAVPEMIKIWPDWKQLSQTQ